MGKSTPGKQKTVRLSEEELKELCQKAVEDGVSKYITVQNQKKRQEWRMHSCLFITMDCYFFRCLIGLRINREESALQLNGIRGYR